MPNVVFTKNTVVQHAPYGAVDTVYTQIEDLQIRQGAPTFNYSTEDPAALSPDPADHSILLLRPQYAHQIPSNATNVRCTVFFNVTGGFGTFTVEARRLLKPWTMFGASFNGYMLDLSWGTPGALGATDSGGALGTDSVGAEGNAWYSVTADAAGASMVAGPRTNEGVAVIPQQPAEGFRFVEKSSGTDGLRPEFHFSYDLPEAGAGGPTALIPSLVSRAMSDVFASVFAGAGGGGGPAAVPTPEVRTIFVWGHSLFDHGLFMSNAFTKTGPTITDLSRQSYNRTSVKQIFGQMRDQVLPPPQAGQIMTLANQFDAWPSAPAAAWETVGWTDAIYMASNFEQQTKTPATFALECDAALTYAEANSPATQKVIYEHWAEPSQYGYAVVNTNEMSPANWADYKAEHTLGGRYHTWHLDFQAAIIADGHPTAMIPVGACIFDALQTEAYLSALAFQDLFVDSSPHPNATMSFMAGLVCYLALYGEPNADFEPMQSTFINAAVRDNLPALITFFQDRLTFHGANGTNLPT